MDWFLYDIGLRHERLIGSKDLFTLFPASVSFSSLIPCLLYQIYHNTLSGKTLVILSCVKYLENSNKVFLKEVFC